MTSNQSKTLWLADVLDCGVYDAEVARTMGKAALELRRLAGVEEERNALLEAAELVIAWFEAEDDHSKAGFYERIEMCRKAEAACRAAIAHTKGGSNV